MVDSAAVAVVGVVGEVAGVVEEVETVTLTQTAIAMTTLTILVIQMPTATHRTAGEAVEVGAGVEAGGEAEDTMTRTAAEVGETMMARAEGTEGAGEGAGTMMMETVGGGTTARAGRGAGEGAEAVGAAEEAAETEMMMVGLAEEGGEMMAVEVVEEEAVMEVSYLSLLIYLMFNLMQNLVV